MSNSPLVSKPKRILVSGVSVSENPAAVWRGLGFVTGNGSSRLLTDYKYKHPDVYETLLQLLFGKGCSAGLSHLKIELGADINSSSGTEPCTMRSAAERADVTRGAGFMLAADAKKVNPELTLDLLRWGEPHWVTAAFAEGQEAGFAARYHWYHETLKAAYETYGLVFDFISPDSNECEQADTAWLIYFAEHLKQETDAPYDFSMIKLAASDEVGSQTISDEMLKNERLRNAIDVIGLHYTTKTNHSTALLHEQFGKEIWYSEGIAPCSIPALSVRTDGCGLAGNNGPIDVANRIINSYANGNMVMYEFQPAVNAYYDGACYSPKQLITANTPWCGHYSVDVGFWLAMHFTRFVQPGWRYVDSACAGDGEEDHAVWNTTHNCMALVSPDRKHLTMHLTNDSEAPRSYLVVVRNLPELPKSLYCVETAGNDDAAAIDENWFHVVQQIRLRTIDGEAAFPVVVRAHSILTITSMDISDICGTAELETMVPEKSRLSLPYTEQFDYDGDMLRARGGAPLYTTDQGGAFEVVCDEGGNYLEQKITKGILPTDWRFRGTPEPLTYLGDDLWANYQAIAEAEFADEAMDNYIGVGVRCNSAVTCPETSACGFALRLYADGRWELRYMDDVLEEGTVPDFQYGMRHKLGISAVGTLLLCFADGHSLHEVKLDNQPIVRSGRMTLQSAYYRNRFYSVTAEPVSPLFGMSTMCYRLDCLAPLVEYAEDASGIWTLHGMAPYQYFNRTRAEGEPGAVLKIRYYGSSISLLGTAEHAAIAVWIDGQLYTEHYKIVKSNYREAFFTLEPLQKGWHTLHLQLLSGELSFDAFELPTDDETAVYPFEPLTSEANAADKDVSRRHGFDLRKAAVPIAGAAAAGVALAFAVGKVGRKMKKRRK